MVSAPLRIKSVGALTYKRRLLVAHHSVLTHRRAREKHWTSDDLATDEVNASALVEEDSLDQRLDSRAYQIVVSQMRPTSSLQTHNPKNLVTSRNPGECYK